MLKKESMINELMEGLAFNYEDAKELVDIILNKEKDINDIVTLYSIKGCRWEEEDLINFIEMSTGKFLPIEKILNNMDCFYRLKSGLIVSWDF